MKNKTNKNSLKVLHIIKTVSYEKIIRKNNLKKQKIHNKNQNNKQTKQNEQN